MNNLLFKFFNKKLISRLLVSFSFLLLSQKPTLSQAGRIYLDGKFSDWQNLNPIHIDPTGDQLTGNVDFGKLWITNDERYLFFRLEIGDEEIIIQRSNYITMYLDTDNNTTTGKQTHGIGAELEWNFGDRYGRFWRFLKRKSVYQNQVRIITAPTISSTEFEIVINRNATPGWNERLFKDNTFRVVFEDRQSQDLLPDVRKNVTYTFDDTTAITPLKPISISKHHPNHLRFLSYNIDEDTLLFDPSHTPIFARIFQAIKPDIIGFQEFYHYDEQQTEAIIETILPSSGQQQWYSSKIGIEIIALSRYPIINSYSIQGYPEYRANGAFLIDLQPIFDTQLLFIVAHTPCCDRSLERQYEIDAIMAFIREAKSPGGELELKPNTPILIVGDMNLVTNSYQLRTLLTGEIVNTFHFGISFSPDWDRSEFADLIPRHTDLPMFYTWQHYKEPFDYSFSPGRLDFMIFSDSVMEPANNYVLYTPAMSPDSLSAYNLYPQDVAIASDHFPIVCDFIFSSETDVSLYSRNEPAVFACIKNYPNPFNADTNIQFELLQNSKVTIEIYNLLGQKICTLLDEEKQTGYHSIEWDGKDYIGNDIVSGLYLYTIQTADYKRVKKMTLLR